MINTVTCKIIGRAHSKGRVSVNAQVFVNHYRLLIPLSIKVEAKYFDKAGQRIRSSHPNANQYNSIIADALERVANIHSDANRNNIYLEKKNFRTRFITTLSDIDFVAFWKSELDARLGTIEKSTWKQHLASFNKFSQFKPSLPFDMVSATTVEDYERYLKRKGNNVNTVACAMKNLKCYINIAIRKGIDIKNPFRFYRIKQGNGRIIFLSVEEQRKLVSMYDNNDLPVHLKESLLIFLVQTFTSLRISDVKLMMPNWIENDNIEFIPQKTRRFRKVVRFGLSDIAIRLCSDLFELKRIKPLKTEQRINDDLKIIAAYAGIKKALSTHVGRHTFATTFLTIGGDIVVLQEIMGHSRIETTRKYAHVIDSRKTEQMKLYNETFK